MTLLTGVQKLHESVPQSGVSTSVWSLFKRKPGKPMILHGRDLLFGVPRPHESLGSPQAP